MINKILIFFIILISFSTTKVNAVLLEDISILVASCDKYAGLWEPFVTLLFKNWPSLEAGNEHQNIPIFFISNKKKLNNLRINNIRFPNEISWSDNISNTLDQINTKYVLYLQEDYLFTDPINIDLLAKILQYAKTQNAAYVSLISMGQTIKNNKLIESPINLAEIDKNSEYRTSLQAAIWEKEVFSRLLKPGENMFVFEKAGSKRSENLDRLFLANVNGNVLKYINAADGGKILESAVDYLHSQNIKFNPDSQQLSLKKENNFYRLIRKIKWKILNLLEVLYK